jgi:ABC-2 type transport system permease protein
VAALGSFDFAFVVVYLAPLCAIALMYDWAAGERESGRLRLLQAMPMSPARLFGQRALLRYGWLAAALVLPLAAASVWRGAPVAAVLAMAAVSGLYLAFWCGLALVVGRRFARAHAAALALLGVLLVLLLLVPAAVNLVMARMLPAGQGARLALEQREAVHRGWDLPKQVTFERFFLTHPEWRDTEPVTGRFHWKWYYAMQQVGDDAVAAQARAYREQLLARQRWASLAGWLDPAVAAQVALHRLADTDLAATLRFWDAIASFHHALRRYHYPFVFNELPFSAQAFEGMPRFEAEASSGELDMIAWFALAAWVGVCCWLGGRAALRM